MRVYFGPAQMGRYIGAIWFLPAMFFASVFVQNRSIRCALLHPYILLSFSYPYPDLYSDLFMYIYMHENEVRKMARNNENIQFAGYVEGTLLEELYSNAYAYILPSTIEGQSIGLLRKK